MNKDTNDQQRIERFLKLLSEATMETGVAVCGCGCCDSPYKEAMESARRPYFTIEEQGWSGKWRAGETVELDISHFAIYNTTEEL